MQIIFLVMNQGSYLPPSPAFHELSSLQKLFRPLKQEENFFRFLDHMKPKRYSISQM